MTDLSRSLLAAAREGLAPDAAIAARVRAKVAASIAAGATTAVATTAASSATPPTSTASAPASATTAASASLLLKLGAALLVVGAVTATAISTREKTGDAPHLSMSTPNDIDETRASVRTVTHDVTATVPVLESRASHRQSAPPPSPSAIEIEVPPIEPTAESVSLSREVELIDLAMTSLRKHAPAAALAAIHTYDRETLGRGQMAEEAAAIAIEARCGLHQDVTDELAAFDRAWPSSAQRSRVVNTCFAK